MPEPNPYMKWIVIQPGLIQLEATRFTIELDEETSRTLTHTNRFILRHGKLYSVFWDLNTAKCAAEQKLREQIEMGFFRGPR